MNAPRQSVRRPSPAPVPRQTGAALGLLLGLVALAGAWGAATVAELAERSRQLQHRQQELVALQQRAAGRGGARTPHAALGDPFLQGASLSLAANALQERVVRIIEETGGHVVSVSVEPIPAQPDPLGRRLVLQVIAEMVNDSLQKALHRLEGEAPALFVDSLLVDRRIAGLAEPEAPGRPMRLRIDLRIGGYARGAGP